MSFQNLLVEDSGINKSICGDWHELWFNVELLDLKIKFLKFL